MSRLGKKAIVIPSGVELKFQAGILSVKGPKGEIKKTLGEKISIEVTPEGVITKPLKESDVVMWGTVASHVMNMIEGVTKGFEKKLLLEGIGYKAEVKGDALVCALGFSHPVSLKIPAGLTLKSEKGSVLISGIDKDIVGAFASVIRSNKKPEPYKGKGFRYDGEVIKMKQGKKTV